MLMDQIVFNKKNNKDLGLKQVPKYYMMSGHDTNVANIIAYLEP